MKNNNTSFADGFKPTRLWKLHSVLQTFAITVVICFSFTTVDAQEDSIAVNTTQGTIDWDVKWRHAHKLKKSRPKVGVVLGGGGAKGASHIGVLKYLDELGIPVDYVAGTSMGSIIGGLYAMGYEADEMATLISNIPWDEFIGNKIDRSTMSFESRMRNSTTLMVIPFDLKNIGKKNSSESLISSLPAAYVNNSGLINLFNDLCIGYQDEMDFNDMPIPFACVATDLITGDEVVLRSGVVPQAMRASMAIPGVFTPIVIGDKVLVDGGLVNNFPADVLKAMGADIVIGVEVTEETTFTTEMLQSLPQLMSRLLTNVTNGKRKENRELCDIYIVPDVSGYGMLSFTPDAIETLVGRGYAKAQEFSNSLLALKAKMTGVVVPKRQELQVPRSINLMNSSVYIKDINIEGVDHDDIPWVVRKGGLKNGSYYTYKDIEKAVSIYRGTNCFDNITYNITKIEPIRKRRMRDLDTLPDKYKLTVKMSPSKPSMLAIGTRYDTEEGAALMTSVGLNEKAFKGHKLNVTTKLSYSPMIGLRYTYSRRSVANFNVDYQYRDQHFRTMYDVGKSVNLHYQQNKISAYISQFHLLNLSVSVGANYQKTRFDKTSLEKESTMDSIIFRKNSTIEPFVNIVYDNQDDAYFARHGVYTRLGSRFYFEPKQKNKSFDLCFTLLANVTPNEGKLTIIPQVYGRYVYSPHYYNQWILFGGEVAGRHFEEQMPFIGFNSVQDVTYDNYVNIARCDVRYNPFGKHYVTAMYNYLFNWSLLQRGSIGGMVVNGVHGAGLKYSYKSLMGPVSLTLHWMRANEQNRFGAHFSLGYYF